MKISNIFFSFLIISTPLYPITGYVRFSESSFCMDSCSIYYLEDEYGEFLTNVTQLDSIEVLNDYINRFVDIEGDTVLCIECEAINVTSIEISDECEFPVACFANPCEVSECTSYPDAACVANYCEGCWADYYLDGELINCDLSMDCVDLTSIDFGDCDMVLGIGWINNNCVTVSGCDWIADSIDYSNAFFDSIDNCNESCSTISNDEITQIPTTFLVHQNYPNPFNPITTLRYDLPENSHVTITIYDMIGRQVKILINQTQDAGYRSVIWGATNDYGKPVSAGIYLYQIQAGEYISTKKMVLLK